MHATPYISVQPEQSRGCLVKRLHYSKDFSRPESTVMFLVLSFDYGLLPVPCGPVPDHGDILDKTRSAQACPDSGVCQDAEALLKSVSISEHCSGWCVLH